MPEKRMKMEKKRKKKGKHMEVWERKGDKPSKWHDAGCMIM